VEKGDKQDMEITGLKAKVASLSVTSAGKPLSSASQKYNNGVLTIGQSQLLPVSKIDS